MTAIIVMSNGDAYHTTDTVADEVLELVKRPDIQSVTTSFIDTKSNKRVIVFIGQISSVVRDEQR